MPANIVNTEKVFRPLYQALAFVTFLMEYTESIQILGFGLWLTTEGPLAGMCVFVRGFRVFIEMYG